MLHMSTVNKHLPPSTFFGVMASLLISSVALTPISLQTAVRPVLRSTRLSPASEWALLTCGSLSRGKMLHMSIHYTSPPSYMFWCNGQFIEIKCNTDPYKSADCCETCPALGQTESCLRMGLLTRGSLS